MNDKKIGKDEEIRVNRINQVNKSNFISLL